ncbi:unnamed protein product [Vitrella brassicaformis CCMP3155]|uniref:PRA1 family protein n=2 Tax=Vitrella brassicaformis TaxID=1169539 RepID=A0A0G4EDU4_VITBC|nr:unnamed protein product [Vitrella brassicaformis CCMP3155]|mmetsp:Transcript_21116/g.51507  ORF Transcript_21116/g.51507 Transcript_21116/m.51507 type:complete len:245 (+) Transcript_21116:94-828(+)|eukprot:CEL93708.1 unnamed protein product [Vitrella brassicaformis CCMP3155]
MAGNQRQRASQFDHLVESLFSAFRRTSDEAVRRSPVRPTNEKMADVLLMSWVVRHGWPIVQSGGVGLTEEQAHVAVEEGRRVLLNDPLGLPTNRMRPWKEFMGEFAPPDHPFDRFTSNLSYFLPNYLLLIYAMLALLSLFRPSSLLIVTVLQYAAILLPSTDCQGNGWLLGLPPSTRLAITLAINLMLWLTMLVGLLTAPRLYAAVVWGALVVHALCRTRSPVRLVADNVKKTAETIKKKAKVT